MRLILVSLIAMTLSTAGWAAGIQNYTPISQDLLLRVSAEPNFPPAPLRAPDTRSHVAACTADAPTCCKIGEARPQCVDSNSQCTDMGGTSVATDSPGCNES